MFKKFIDKKQHVLIANFYSITINFHVKYYGSASKFCSLLLLAGFGDLKAIKIYKRKVAYFIEFRWRNGKLNIMINLFLRLVI